MTSPRGRSALFDANEHIRNDERKNDRLIHNDAAREGIAENKILDYVSHLSIYWLTVKPLTQVRDDSLAYLRAQRESEYYQSIKAKVLAGERVLPHEYYYFVLTTENLQWVDVEMLEEAERLFDCQNCAENLMVVKAALHFKRAQSEEEKKHYQQELADSIRFYCKNEIRPLFLNLAGVDISGADLMDIPKEDRGRRSTPHLNFVDLSGAKLNGCNMFSLHINYSDLTDASFRDVYGDRKGERCGPRIYDSIATKACFDGIEFVRGSCQQTDFTGASFKRAKFREMALDNSCFENADFEGATINNLRDCRNASFTNANFINATLKKVGFSLNDFTGARFIIAEKLDNIVSFQEELTRLADELLLDFDVTSWWDQEQKRALLDLIANDIVRCAAEKFMDPALQRDIYAAAANHPLFHHHETVTSQIICGAKSLYNSTVGTLFSGYGKYHSDNPTVKFFEDLCEQIDAMNTPVM